MNTEYYLRFVTGIEKMSDYRTRYYVGNHFIVEATKCEHNLKDKHDLMNLWHKHGFIAQPLETHIAIETYYQDDDGSWWGLYNPTIKNSEDGKQRVINFDFVREWSFDNEEDLVAECIRMYERNIIK